MIEFLPASDEFRDERDHRVAPEVCKPYRLHCDALDFASLPNRVRLIRDALASGQGREWLRADLSFGSRSAWLSNAAYDIRVNLGTAQHADARALAEVIEIARRVVIYGEKFENGRFAGGRPEKPKSRKRGWVFRDSHRRNQARHRRIRKPDLASGIIET